MAWLWGGGRESRGAVTGLGLRVSELVSHLMLLHVTLDTEARLQRQKHSAEQLSTHLCSKSFTANLALERPFFGVAPHVDLKCRVAREHFKADLAGRLTTRCKNIFHQWI